MTFPILLICNEVGLFSITIRSQNGLISSVQHRKYMGNYMNLTFDTVRTTSFLILIKIGLNTDLILSSKCKGMEFTKLEFINFRFLEVTTMHASV